MKRIKRNDGGFTLMELTLVALILSIITTLAIPVFKSLYEKSEVQRAVSEFISTLRYAQQRAVMERVPIRVVVNVDKKVYWVPVEEDKERRHYETRSRRHRASRRRDEHIKRVREVKEIQSALPKGFIFEFVYKLADRREVRRGDGEIYFYPDGSADAAYITILRLAKTKEDERRVFMKVISTTGTIKSMEGTAERQGSDFYRGLYDDGTS